MPSLPVITDNLAARISAILLGAFVILALAVGVLMLWPHPGGGSSGLFQLPVPAETIAVVDALETVPPASRPLVLRALNTSVVSVRLEPDFPPIPLGLKRAPGLEALFKGYADALQGRQFRVDLRKGVISSFFSLGGARAPVSVQMSIRLRDGEVLVIDRRPPAVMRSYIARAAVAVAFAALVLLGALALAVRQTAGPVNDLALAVRRFSLDEQMPDLPMGGPRELRDLAMAFNEMHRRIRSLVQDRTRVLGAVAHDLRTYLTRLRLRADFIADEDQRLRAERDIEEMSQLLDDILLFAQQATKPSTDVEVIDLAVETADFVAVRAELGETVSLAGDPPLGVCMVRCPRLAYRRMLTNLGENALRYGGAARLTVTADGDWIVVAVDDDGPGVDEAVMSRILEPFERLEASRARSTGGAGLGLAIVKGLVESVAGELVLQNRAEGGLRASLRFNRD